MLKGAKKSNPAVRQSFSIVHRYIQHFNEVSGNKSAVIRRRSKTSGVMITQYEVKVPEGKSTPDFQYSIAPVTIQEGKLATFKAMVKGNPKPEVSWRRIKGNILDKDKCQNKYDESTGEHILEIHNVSHADTDTYKCYAVNKYGKAVCMTTLQVTDASTDPSDFRKLLRKSKVERADGLCEETFLDAMLHDDRKDHEHISYDFGAEELHLILMKLELKKKERMQNKCKDGKIPCDKNNFDGTGGTKDFSFKRLIQENMGLCQVDVEKLNHIDTLMNQADAEDVIHLLTELKFSNVDFVIKIQEINALEREDALFQCVLTHPLPRIIWMGKGSTLEDGEKYSITVSDNKLIHRLLIKDCTQLDKGIYSAVAGVMSCSAWLVVEADADPTCVGMPKHRKTTVAGGARTDLDKVAKEQQINNQRVIEKILAAVRAKHKEEKTCSTGEITAVTGLGIDAKPDAARASALSQQIWRTQSAEINNPGDNGKVSQLDASLCVTTTEAQVIVNDAKNKKIESGQVDYDNETESRCKGTEVELHQMQMFATGENEVTDSEGNKRLSRHKRKVRQKHPTSDPSKAASDDEDSDTDGNEDCSRQANYLSHTKQTQRPQHVDNERSDCDETDDGFVTHKMRHKRQGPLTEDPVIDTGVQFICGLTDVSAIVNEAAELTCKLSSEDCEGVWFRDGKKVYPDDNFIITKDGAIHKLMIIKCTEEHSGKYRFEADGRKTEGMINVKDPPRFDPDELNAFTRPVTVKVGHSAIFKLHFLGHEPIKIQWYRDGEELQDNSNTKLESSGSHSRLLLSRCQRKETGEIKIKLKNEHGFAEAVSQLIVLDKPTAPLGPAEVIESSAIGIEFRWRPPKDDGGSPVINYVIERRQVGRNTWKKIGEVPGVVSFRDTDVDHGRKYCYRVRAVTAEGTSEVMETKEMQAGTLSFPGPPASPKVESAYDDCINLCWAPPNKTGGSRILGYILERRKKGSNLWTVVNATDEPIKEKKYAVKDVVAGMEYEFRVTAINLSGVGESSNPSEFVFARDPKKPPGKVTGLKVTETSYSHLVLTWTKPEEKQGIQDEAKGYFVEIRQADCIEWSRCTSAPVITTSFSAKGLKPMEMYWVRVTATNDGGESAPEELDKYVLAMPSPVKPKFTNNKMKSFMVVRAGNSVRITVNFEASPWPDVTWLKDNVPVTKRATISNCDGSSQLLIPSSERSDSGIYSVLVKNLAGQETFSIEVRVTDDPKPPGLVELEENVPGTVTVIWEPSPDEKRDDRLHYIVSKLDSTKRTWTVVADSLFNNKFTVCNIMQGREYNFRVYAKNDIGISAASESPIWGTEKKKEKLVVGAQTRKACDLRCAPSFIVPLKLHTAPKGYECYMSCAVNGNPQPRVTWYRNHISLNTNTNYYISNTCGVCSMLILQVSPKDMGEYRVSAENDLGRAECSTVLSVRE